MPRDLPFYPWETLQMKRIVLDKLKQDYSILIHPEDLHISSDPIAFMGSVYINITRTIAGRKIFESVDFESVPQTWWQMFKEQYFPIWAKKRFPIIYRRILKNHIEQNIVFPGIVTGGGAKVIYDFLDSNTECVEKKLE